MQILLNSIERFGFAGLLLTMVLEGLAVPIPGIFIIIAIGSSLNLGFMEVASASIVMSAAYSAASFVPYMLGMKMERVIGSKYKKQMDAVRNCFGKYGESSIALFRPFAVGNYISFFAGLNRMKILKYAILTFIGILPWSFGTLAIGAVSRMGMDSVISLVQSFSSYIYEAALIIILAVIIITVLKRSRARKPAMHSPKY